MKEEKPLGKKFLVVTAILIFLLLLKFFLSDLTLAELKADLNIYLIRSAAFLAFMSAFIILLANFFKKNKLNGNIAAALFLVFHFIGSDLILNPNMAGELKFYIGNILSGVLFFLGLTFMDWWNKSSKASEKLG